MTVNQNINKNKKTEIFIHSFKAFYQIISILTISAYCFSHFLSKETNVAVCFLLGFILFYVSFHGAEKKLIKIFHKKTKKLIMILEKEFIFIPIFSRYNIEKVEFSQLMNFYVNKTYSPTGNNFNISIILGGDFMIVNPQQYLYSGGSDSFSGTCVNQLKKEIKQHLKTYGTVTKENLQDISWEVKQKMQDRYGILFNEHTDFSATIY